MEIDVIIIGALFAIGGIAFIGFGIYNRWFRSYIPNPKKWGKARAKVIGRHHYTVKNMSKYSGYAFTDHYEKCIAYTVDGKMYKKYVDDTENGAVHIWYRLNNPNVIRTMSEVRRSKWEGKTTLSLGTNIFCGTVMLIIGVAIMYGGLM